MQITNSTLVPISQVKINREDRQRKDAMPDAALLSSIRQRGVYHPVILADDYTLIAGERRVNACKELGIAQIPARFMSDLSPEDRMIVELEENIKRKDLSWREQVKSIGVVHTILSRQDSQWTRQQTAEYIGITPAWVTECLRVYKDLDSARIAQSTSIREAYNVLARMDERAANDAVAEIMQNSVVIAAPQGSGPAIVPPPMADSQDSIFLEDFLTWAPAYTGQKFNFIHCDFPYGLDVFAGQQAGGARSETYDDDPDVYWRLIRCLCENLDRLMTHSGHLMFWFSMEYYQETLLKFRTLAPSLEFNVFPLIWLKSDNTGILPDSNRGPRRIYETAFIASRADRLIAKPVANGYAAPTDRRLHPSTKPEPVLRHFFQMFVDNGTRMLDPTCGSGASLRAAESLSASHVTGLEINPEYFANATTELRKFRSLRSVAQ